MSKEWRFKALFNSLKFKRQICRFVASVAPWIKLKVIFIPGFKLLRLCKLKCKYSLLSLSGVVYRVNCSSCKEFYVGMTTRPLEQRLQEHSTLDHSALKRHSLDTKHSIDYTCPAVLASDQNRARLYIKEALKIKETSAHLSLNGNVGSSELKLW